MKVKICPLCNRSDVPFERHHLKTHRKDADDMEKICGDCHKAIHRLFSNTELRTSRFGVDSIEGLLSNEHFLKIVEFIKKLSKGKRLDMKRGKFTAFGRAW